MDLQIENLYGDVAKVFYFTEWVRLEWTIVDYLVQLPAQAGSPQGTGLCPVDSGISSLRETSQSLWEITQNQLFSQPFVNLGLGELF